MLDVQNEFIDGLATRVVVPLRTAAAFGRPARDLNPVIPIQGNDCVLDTAALGAIPVVELKRVVGNLNDQRSNILGALDALFGAF